MQRCGEYSKGQKKQIKRIYKRPHIIFEEQIGIPRVAPILMTSWEVETIDIVEWGL